MAKGKKSTERRPASEALTAIRVAGFKCFRDPVDVAIRPLTLLAGANSGGKSSLMQPLLLMKQTLEAPFDPGPLLLDGPLVRVEMATTLGWRGKTSRDRATTFSVETGGAKHRVESTFSVNAKRSGVKLASTDYKHRSMRLTENMSEDDLSRLAETVFGPGGSTRFKLTVDRSRSFLYAMPMFRDAPEVSKRNDLLTVLQDWGHEDHSTLLLNLIDLPGLRGNPERAYPRTHATERFPGPFQSYTAGLLLGWRETKDDRLAAVGHDLLTLGLSWKVDPRPRGDTGVEVQIGRLPRPRQGGASDMVNIADVGFGASQVLPVVVALQTARPGQVVHIEQPELHLHPRAQAAMADLLIAAAKRQAIVIVETHSSVLLLAVQRRIAEGVITPAEVALHWFERDEDGASHVRTADLDQKGAYGDWPVDFAEVEMEVERAYIDAAFGAEPT